ncbi:glycerol-3-phosphate acyltransferase [Lactobacillus sp. LL6]|uniref:glycerol-3-phosphate acyltransferase n=1 Tax=Lactobacillus sp. LL6 TaxID=2596827 RepID=UPI001184FB83|nr:glycerol-3-phosphate acyltransferase [Lactobacillus sp. LL6]TSO25732.1 hypothetical protein FOD82_01240 [Lactobacillus sp. LL6]
MAPIWSILIGYVFGNFLFAMIIGRFVLHLDPTQYGSGNPGTANMGAVFGKKWGILTCVGDLLKTAIALLIVYFLFPGKVYIAYTGLGLMLGHCFPIWNHFKGGKGVAVSILVALAYDWKAGLITVLIALVLTAIMQNLTIPPLIFMVLFSMYEFTQSLTAGIIFCIITVIMIFKFRHDIVDFFMGRGKRVDILYSIKKKLGIKK